MGLARDDRRGGEGARGIADKREMRIDELI